MADRRRGGTGRVRNLAVCSVLLGLPTVQALAQTQTAGGFEQLGLRTEGWNIFPSLSLSAAYNDNVFAVPEDSVLLEDDIYFVVAPEVTLEADTQRHALAISGGARIGRYLNETDQNFNDFNAGVAGRWDVTRTFDIAASFRFARTQEDQTDPDRGFSGVLRRETTQITAFTGQLTARKDWQRTFATAGARVDRRSFEELEATVFDPVSLLPVDTVDVNADRDRFRIPLNLRVGYDVDRDYNLFVDMNYTLVRYDEPEVITTTTVVPVVVDGTLVGLPVVTGVTEGDDQDFETLSLRVGTGVDFDRLVSGEFSVGVERLFEDDEDEGQDLGFSFAADLDWTLSPRTSLNLSGSQGFEPATGDDAGGNALRTRLGLDLTYALSPQLAVSGNVAYLRDDRGEDDRKDDDITTGLEASYAINRYASVSASYQYRQRTSTDAAREFERNLVFLTLVGRY
jgi:hypothetical protein